MAQVKTDFGGLTKPEKLAKAAALVAAGTGNPNFPSPQPALAAVGAAEYNANVATTTLAGLRTQLQAAEAEEAEEAAAYGTLDDKVASWGSVVQGLSGGDATKIASSGLEVRSTDRAPIAMTQPQDVNASAGDEPGEVDLACEPVRAARTYEVQATTDLTGATGWQTVLLRSRSRLPVTGLISGTKYAFRIRAIGASDTGPWSNVVQKMAP